MTTADYWIRRLNLTPHPEGGYFRETYRAREWIPPAGLPRRYSGRRSFSTTILFLLEGAQVSRLHRLKSDEVWHFYEGAPLTLHLISPEGSYSTIVLGRHAERRERFQAVVQAGTWFGATVSRRNAYALAGCTVAPGFEFEDFELADRQRLLALCPRHRRIIVRLTQPAQG